MSVGARGDAPARIGPSVIFTESALWSVRTLDLGNCEVGGALRGVGGRRTLVRDVSDLSLRSTPYQTEIDWNDLLDSDRADYDLALLGEWHAEPIEGPPEPSPTDRANWSKIAKRYRRRFLAAIVRPESATGSFGPRWGAAAGPPGGYRRAARCSGRCSCWKTRRWFPERQLHQSFALARVSARRDRVRSRLVVVV